MRTSRNIGSAERLLRCAFLIYIPDLDANILGLAEKGIFLRFVFEEVEMPVPARELKAKQHRHCAIIILRKKPFLASCISAAVVAVAGPRQVMPPFHSPRAWGRGGGEGNSSGRSKLLTGEKSI